MKKPTIAILRGRPTSGKSTAWHNLKKRKEMDGWIFIDFCKIKDDLGETLNDEERKNIGKKFLFALLREAIKTSKSIIIEEMSRTSVEKRLKSPIKKYNYEIIVFQFTVCTETAYKRDVQRARDKWHPFMGKKWIEEGHRYHDKNIDPKGIVVDSNKLGKKAVVEFILKELELKIK
jgi:predicted kinase